MLKWTKFYAITPLRTSIFLMTDTISISQFPVTGVLTGTELVPVVKDALNQAVTIDTIVKQFQIIKLFADRANFPLVGDHQYLYIDQSTTKIYYWDTDDYTIISENLPNVELFSYRNEFPATGKTNTLYIATFTGLVYYFADGDYHRASNIAETNTATGFVDNSQSTISFDETTRRFTIAPAMGHDHFDFYVAGEKVSKFSPVSVVLDDISQNNFIYFDKTTRDLAVSHVFDATLITTQVLVSVVNWNSTQQRATLVAEERHGLTMDGDTHLHFHESFGCQWVNGLALGNIVVDGNGSLPTHGELSVSNGVIRDEDLRISIMDGAVQDLSPTAQIPVLYRIGMAGNGQWHRTLRNNYPVINHLNASELASTTRLGYNYQSSPDVWAVAEVPNNQFVLMHIFATNDIYAPVMAVCGNTYATVSQARKAAAIELGQLTGLPFNEFVPVGTVIYQSSNNYTNEIKARIVSTEDGTAYYDWRHLSSLKGSSSAAYAGTSLTTEDVEDIAGGMVDGNTEDGVSVTYDDTLGKLNFTNTDKGSTAVSSHTTEPDPHPQYLTQTEGDGRYALAGMGGGGTGISATDQTFLVSGTWSKPSGATWVTVIAQAPGGGGGSGSCVASSTQRSGGAGGSAGATTVYTFLASDLPAEVSVTIGAPGVGGASTSVSGSAGSPGTNGGSVTFGTFLAAQAGAGGAAGAPNATASGGPEALSGGGDSINGTPGGAGQYATASVGTSTIFGASTGGGGGTGTLSGTASTAGGVGGKAFGGSVPANSSRFGGPLFQDVLGGTAGVGLPGGNGNAFTIGLRRNGTGGGGGGYLANSPGRSGGNGGGFGSGGGGGSASDLTFPSGAGGNAGPGYMRIISW